MAMLIGLLHQRVLAKQSQPLYPHVLTNFGIAKVLFSPGTRYQNLACCISRSAIHRKTNNHPEQAAVAFAQGPVSCYTDACSALEDIQNVSMSARGSCLLQQKMSAFVKSRCKRPACSRLSRTAPALRADSDIPLGMPASWATWRP